MKKILLGCVSASILLGGIAFIGFMRMQPSSIKIPTQIQHPNVKVYTLEEEQILSAAETYLYYKNLNELIHVDVKADGNDFIITFENPTEPDAPKQALKMVRIADFNGKKQYKISSETWANLAESVRESLPNPQMSIDEYTQTISWVPDLSLTTNTSLKATNIVIQDTDLSLTIGSIISDSLVGPQNNKMDVAAAITINDLNVKTALFDVNIPKIILDTQITGADQTAVETMQALSAKRTVSSLMVPTLSIESILLGDKKITTTLENTFTFEKDIQLSMRISDIKVPDMPTLPNNVSAKVSLVGLDRDDIISYIKLSNQYNELENHKTSEARNIEQQLDELYNKVAPKLSIKIDDINLSFPNGSISLSGIIKPDGETLTSDTKIQVTNFDTLSPEAQPVDKEACAKELEHATKNMPLPPACEQKTGMLEFLRPFLDTAKRTTNANGQDVDTFHIQYSENHVSINGHEIVLPEDISVKQIKSSQHSTK